MSPELLAELNSAFAAEDIPRQFELADQIEKLGTPDDLATAAWVRGTALTYRKETDAALAEFDRSLRIGTEYGLQGRVMQALEGRGRVWMALDQYYKAIEAFNEIIPLAEAENNRHRLAHVFGLLGVCYDTIGDYPSARAYLTRALEIHIDEKDRNNEAVVRFNIGTVLVKAFDYDGGLDYFMEALRVFEEDGLRHRLAYAYTMIGSVYSDTGNISKAREYLERALGIARELEGESRVAQIQMNLAELDFESGDLEQSLERFQHAAAVLSSDENSAAAAAAQASAAVALVRLGRLDEAHELLEHLDLSDQPIFSTSFRWYRAHGVYRQARGDLEGAQEAFASCLELAQRAGFRGQEIIAHHDLRELAELRGDLPAYVEHNKAYYRIKEETTGDQTTQKLAMFEAENTIAEERRERDRERAILYSTLPSQVADRLVRGEDVSGDEHDTAAVIFADIVRFTDHAANVPAKQISQVLADLFSAFDALCDESDVTKIKTIGDSYLAVAFGEDNEGADHLRRAAQVALGMLAVRTTWPSGEPLSIRVGIHSGPLVSGVIGTQRLQYDVWGDTVNVASRMESTGEAGKVQVSEAFAQQLRLLLAVAEEEGPANSNSQQQLRERGAIEVKGKGRMTTYWLEPV